MSPKFQRIALIAVILVVAIVGAGFLSKLKAPPQKKDVEQVPVLVDVLQLERSDVDFEVVTQGTVRPRTETVLSAEVSGSIISVSPKFVAGGVFTKGEELMRIDPTNYIVAVDQSKALLKQRQIEYDGVVSLRDKGYRAEAELASAAAALATAKAELVRARQNLEKTHIRLPYEGMVKTKEGDHGQYVSLGSRLGVTFATDYAEVRLPLTEQDLAFVDLPAAKDISGSGAADGPAVKLSASQRGQLEYWNAKIVRSEGVVDENTRVTYAVARIDDPYRRHSTNSAVAPLPIGTFVAARIAGSQAASVIRVPRTALRGRDQLVFVDTENKLRIRPVDVLRADAEFAYVQGGAEPGERICITALDSPVNGMVVRVSGESVESPSLASQ